MYLINFSGHPAPRGSEGFEVIEVPSLEIAPIAPEVAAVAEALVKGAAGLPGVDEALRRGEAQVLLPGYSPLAVAVAAAAAGIMGRMPSVRWGIRRKNGYVLSAPLDLQGLRNRMRTAR